MIAGTDIPVQITLTDSEGEPIVISSVEDIVVNLFTVRDTKKTLFATARLQATDSDYEIATVEDEAGVISFVIPRSKTAEVTRGNIRVFLEVLVQTSAGSEYADQLKVSGENELEEYIEIETSPDSDVLV